MGEFTGPGAPLSAEGVTKTSETLGVGLPELWAVLAVETRGCGFLRDRRPKILFERHVFHRLTKGEFSSEAPDLSSSQPGEYGQNGPSQYDRLARAIRFDRKAALESASWGIGQVMGFNCARVGFDDVEAMVSRMVSSEDAQLDAMLAYCQTAGLVQALKDHHWDDFARGYNGPEYAQNAYHIKLAGRYLHYKTRGLPSVDVRAAQVYLLYAGFDTGPIDGELGPRTIRALKRYQAQHNLPQTGQLDSQTRAALEAT